MRRCQRPEQALHRAAVAYLRLLENLGELVFFHPANGGVRSRTEAAIFKGLGVRAGVPDLVVLFPGARCAFIELKSDVRRLSAAQLGFKNHAEMFGFPYATCRDLNEVERFVRKLIASSVRVERYVRDTGTNGTVQRWP